MSIMKKVVSKIQFLGYRTLASNTGFHWRKPKTWLMWDDTISLIFLAVLLLPIAFYGKFFLLHQYDLIPNWIFWHTFVLMIFCLMSVPHGDKVYLRRFESISKSKQADLIAQHQANPNKILPHLRTMLKEYEKEKFDHQQKAKQEQQILQVSTPDVEKKQSSRRL